MVLAALQISENSDLLGYLKLAKKAGAKAVLLNEYALCPFFKNLEKYSSAKLKSVIYLQNQKLKAAFSFCKKNKIALIAPIITLEKNKFYKEIIVFSADSAPLKYRAQRLISYSHWNEKEFFSNKEPKIIKTPLIFELGDLRCAVVFGFELHFDEIWLSLKKAQIDCVFLPTAATFDSGLRWRSLIRMRAFLGSFYILRANRTGGFYDEKSGIKWHFYGDSLLSLPNGEILECLGDKEEMLITQINAQIPRDNRAKWGFAEI